MTVIRITTGPLRGVALQTRRRSLIQRIGAMFRSLMPRRPVRMVAPVERPRPEMPVASGMETSISR